VEKTEEEALRGLLGLGLSLGQTDRDALRPGGKNVAFGKSATGSCYKDVAIGNFILKNPQN
jgi:hypothetical protein